VLRNRGSFFSQKQTVTQKGRTWQGLCMLNSAESSDSFSSWSRGLKEKAGLTIKGIGDSAIARTLSAIGNDLKILKH
jgi:hypothetical protein